MGVLEVLPLLRRVNKLLQRVEDGASLLPVLCSLRNAIIGGLSSDGWSLQGGTTAEVAMLARLTVEVAERLVQLEDTRELLLSSPVSIACAAGAGASCAMLAKYLPLGAGDLARVAAAAAVTLGSGRSVMLATQRGIMSAFASDVAPPALLLGWLQDAAAMLTRLGSLGTAHRAEVGPLVPMLTSYACVLGLAVNANGQPYASIHAALASPNLVQPLLLGLAEAPPALRGQCSPAHAKEVWELLMYVGTALKCAELQGGQIAQRLLSSSARPGGPVLWELVRDVAVCLPRGCPADVLPLTYAGVCVELLGTLTLAPYPAGGISGSSSDAAAAPLSPAEWAAVEIFKALSPAIRAAATPPSQLDRALLPEAGSVVHCAIASLLPLLGRAVHTCSPQQLQLMFDVAWEAAHQLPLLVAGRETEAALTAESRGQLGALSLALLDPLVAAALQLACPTPTKAGGSGHPCSPEHAVAATSLLQQTHLRLCKMTHFCAASVPAEQRATQAALGDAGQVLGLRLAECFKALQFAFWQSAASSGPQEGSSPSDLQQRQLAHATAQWEAVQVLAAQGALVPQAALVASGFRQEAPVQCTVLYHSFVHLLACCPGALRDSPWLRLIMSMLTDHFRKLQEAAPMLAQEDEFFAPFLNMGSTLNPVIGQQEVIREMEVDVLAFALQRLAADGGLAAALLSHRKLPALLGQAAGTPASDKKFGALVEQLSAALHSMLSAASAVTAAGGQEAGGPEGGQPAATDLAELAAAAASLEAGMAAASFPAPPAGRPDYAGKPFTLPTWEAAHAPLFQRGGGSGSAGGFSPAAAGTAPSGPTPKASLAAFRTTLLPCAVRLAAALLPHWPPPAQQQAERLEVAQAVAACRPGCSNLRCPDWQGQHKKAMRCGGCKVARYCSAACQTEAWRHGGHKWVCKLLAAGDA